MRFTSLYARESLDLSRTSHFFQDGVEILTNPSRQAAVRELGFFRWSDARCDTRFDHAWYNRCMDTTNISLLERLKLVDDQGAWSRFVNLYTPLLYTWARQTGMQEADAGDLVQDVFAQLVQKMPSFSYDRAKSFRGWLRTLTVNKWRDRRRRLAVRAREVTGVFSLDMAEPAPQGAFSEVEYREYLAARALELIQAEFQEKTWRAFWEFAVLGHSAAEVSRLLGISENAVFLAKSRVLRRLRQELEGLIDSF